MKRMLSKTGTCKDDAFVRRNVSDLYKEAFLGLKVDHVKSFFISIYWNRRSFSTPQRAMHEAVSEGCF